MLERSNVAALTVGSTQATRTRLKASDHVEVDRPKLSSVIGENVHDPVRPSQGHTGSICEAEFHISPLPIKFPGRLDRLLIDLQHYYRLGGEDVGS